MDALRRRFWLENTCHLHAVVMEYGILAFLAVSSGQQTQPIPTIKSDYSNVLMVKPLFDLEVLETKKETEKPKELTLEEKIAANINNCTETQWIRADNAECIDKSQNTRSALSGYRYSVSTNNTYDAGYCTWYVKNKRPDLPNSLGNANRWYINAQAIGLSTGTTPQKGAVGVTTAGRLGHVVYVESINGDGTINISEMNYEGLYRISSRVASASDFVYIY
jgi:surface antigen